ncbi:MAG: MarR family winged helix-turn-helix transcriptional regulator [Acidimicrobiales bacterium]
MTRQKLSDADYRRLLTVRTGLRSFFRWSERQAALAGLTPAQHELLLAVRGHDDPRGPTISDLASHLLLRHHSVVGLVDRADARGLVVREGEPEDHRVVRVRLSRDGERSLEALSAQHLEELRRLAPDLQFLWQDLEVEPG